MLIILTCFLVLVFLLDRTLRRGRVEFLIDRTRYQLFALRDFLRNEAMAGNVDPHSWVFDYLDSSLTRSAASLDHVTVYRDVLSAFIASRKSKLRAERQYKRLMQDLTRQKNERLFAIHSTYVMTLQDFLQERHRITLPLLRKVVGVFERSKHNGDSNGSLHDQLKQKGAKALNTDPEISTLREHCPV